MYATASPALGDLLSQTPPGAELARLLESVDRTQLDEWELVDLMEARARQIAHLQAEFYADMWAVAEAAKPLPGEGMYEFAREEIASALRWTARATDRHLGLAYRLKEHPQVRQALSEGSIDLPRARVIVEGVSPLGADKAARVVDTVLASAPDRTTGQIAARLHKLVIAADPEAAAERYSRSVADREVHLQADPQGTATLYGWCLPTDQALRAFDHVDRIARALKNEDEERTLDQLRADVLLDLLQGKHFSTNQPKGVIDLRIDLTTLAGLDDRPGEVPGFGPIIADVARRLAQEQAGSEWRVTVTDPDGGRALWVGATKRRPAAALRRHIESSNPTCVFPGCRRSSTRSDLDHRQPWSRGGATTADNLTPLCRRHHRAKHEGGWSYTPTVDQTYVWTSPLGHRYHVKPEAP